MRVADCGYFAKDIEVVDGLNDQGAAANVEQPRGSSVVAIGSRMEQPRESAIVQLLDLVVGRQGLEPWTR